MTKQPHTREVRPKTAQPGNKPGLKPAAAPTPAPLPAPAAEPSPDQLTPEQQMERFAKELKNEDWGHQPC
jgi:hypothetical protein